MAANEVVRRANDRALNSGGGDNVARRTNIDPQRVSLTQLIRTQTTATTTTETDNRQQQEQQEQRRRQVSETGGEQGERAVVEELGRQAGGARLSERGAGSERVTSLASIAAASSQSRIVVALLRDGDQLELKIQEMRPGFFEVGASLGQCRALREEHARALRNLERQKSAPLESWMTKYKRQESLKANMTAELRLIYMCMAESLQGCWRGLLSQLEQRLELLDETCQFYLSVEQLLKSLDKADEYVQVCRAEFLAGPMSARFAQAASELKRLNERVLTDYLAARARQAQLVELIGRLAASNLDDARANLLVTDAQALVDFVRRHLEPLERRKLQLESVLTASGSNLETNEQTFKSQVTEQSDNFVSISNRRSQPQQQRRRQTERAPEGPAGREAGAHETSKQPTSTMHSSCVVREIASFNDLTLVENWLNLKIEQLNSSLLSSLGANAQDTRSILNKHEQIALECSAIEGATLKFNGKNIHALRDYTNQEQAVQVSQDQQVQRLFEQQRQLAQRARQVITILDARIVLLRRTIDFYSRARDATGDIKKLLRRLQVDNSLQSVQYVADELELKDVSSVVASGATIISELQQLQLAQQHGQRSKLVNLELVTGGIRAIIDQLNQDLAHLKTVLGQRRLVLLNEDASKMAQNFTSKCHQLKFWLDNQIKAQLLSQNRLPFEVEAVRNYCVSHDQMRQAVRQKTQEVEALLRLLSTLLESFDAKSETAGELQRDTDELRQDWITVTNCLERRLDLARKYLALLVAFGELGRQIDKLASEPDEETRTSIEGFLSELRNQVDQFSQEAQRNQTALAHHQAQPLEARATLSDINKQQLVGHVNGALKLLAERHKSTVGRLNARGPRKWLQETTTTTTNNTNTTNDFSTKQNETLKTKVTQIESVNEVETKQVGGPARVRRSSTGMQVAPRFAKPLRDLQLEPFSAAVLECELDPASTVNLAGNYTHQIKVEWLLNNKRIPANIKHSVSCEANRHRLLINQFGPTACGQYTALATNQLNGLTASTSCRLKLAGIREVDDQPVPQGKQKELQTMPTANMARLGPQAGPSPTVGTTSSSSTSRPQRSSTTSNKQTRAMERLIQGVESPSTSHDDEHTDRRTQQDLAQTTSATTTTTTTTTTISVNGKLARLPLTQATYNGREMDGGLNYIDSPAGSRSISRSPFDGTPQPPMFTRAFNDSLAHLDSRAGLVCVVMGNPPPQVEWLHEGRPVASAKCARPPPGQPRANVCKLTIETLDDKTQGQYVCRATNKLGQSSTTLTLAK